MNMVSSSLANCCARIDSSMNVTKLNIHVDVWHKCCLTWLFQNALTGEYFVSQSVGSHRVVYSLFAFQFAESALHMGARDSEGQRGGDAAAMTPLPGWSLHEQLYEVARLHLVPASELTAEAITVGDARNERMFDALRLSKRGAATSSSRAANNGGDAFKDLDSEPDGGASARRKQADGQGWRLTEINADYSFCDSYPRQLVVPASIDDDVLQRVGKFRSRQRIPACVYVHSRTRAAIARCAQPLVGLRRTRCQVSVDVVDLRRSIALHRKTKCCSMRCVWPIPAIRRSCVS